MADTPHPRTAALSPSGPGARRPAGERALCDRSPAPIGDRACSRPECGARRPCRRRLRLALCATLSHVGLARPRSPPARARALPRLVDGSRSGPAAARRWGAEGAVDAGRTGSRCRALQGTCTRSPFKPTMAVCSTSRVERRREPDGSLALGGYPAFVGAPASSRAAARRTSARSRRLGARDGGGACPAQLPGARRIRARRRPRRRCARLAAGRTLVLQSLDSLDWSADRPLGASRRARPRQAWTPSTRSATNST